MFPDLAGLFRKDKMRKPSQFEMNVANRLSRFDSKIESEYQFDSNGRKWRFDFAVIEKKIAIEAEGGVWMSQSRHTTGKGFNGDCEKYNSAILQGWRVLRYTPDMIDNIIPDLQKLGVK
jgi:very-short-patch-repair endonuclease